MDGSLQTLAPTDGVSVPAQLAPPPIDPSKLRNLGVLLASNFKTYENYRRQAELRWARNLRQFLGEYDPDVKKMLDADRSQAYPRTTRIKVVSMVSRLMNLLFPTSEKNWGIEPSPVPNLTMEDLQAVLAQAKAGVEAAQKQLTDGIIEGAIRAFAKVRAGNLEMEIDDQLAEVGGNRNMSYVALARAVLYSGVLYGCGVLKGPFVREQKQRRWVRGPDGNYAPQEYTALRPQFQFVPVWDYYPDMTAKHLGQMDGQFHRLVFSKAQLRELADRGDFFAQNILNYLRTNPRGNWKERNHETDLRTMGVQSNVNVTTSSKYEIIIWDGVVASETLKLAGIELPQGLSDDMVDASVWMIDDVPIKCDISPWVELEPDQRVQMYHHFVFEEDDTNLLGNGLPNIMRDSQMGIAAATRMAMDNASVVCGPQLEANTSLLDNTQDLKRIHPYKIWYRDDANASTAVIPAIREIKIDSHISDLAKLIEMFQQFADQETFVGPATGGDMQKMPSEPFRSAAGASLLKGDMALPFKDVVRNFDMFTVSVVTSLILFNKHFNTNAEVRGDFTPIARGSSSLIAKEVRGMALDMLSSTLQPEERLYINWLGLLKEKLKVRDVDITGVVVDDDEAQVREQAQSQREAEDAAGMKELMKAEVRKLLADATKSLTQSDSNSAKSEVALYNAVLGGLESGVTPTDVHATRSGAGIPAAIARGFRLTSGADTPPAARSGK